MIMMKELSSLGGKSTHFRCFGSLSKQSTQIQTNQAQLVGWSKFLSHTEYVEIESNGRTQLSHCCSLYQKQKEKKMNILVLVFDFRHSYTL